MSKYIGQSCTSCRAVFKEGDEIVVCPECGSPYHKDCYKSEGRCVNTVLHETGKEWQPVIPELNNAENHSEVTERICPNCGEHNAPTASFCTRCGTALSGESVESSRQFGGQNYGGQGQYGPFGQQGGMPNVNLPPFINVQSVSPETDVDGITVGEYAEYVRTNTVSYIPKFIRFAKFRKKLSFNIAAFFITPLWFAYRKMPLYSAITMLLSAICSIPAVIDMMVQAGIVQFSGLNTPLFSAISTVCYFLSYAISIVCGLFGDFIYYKHAKSDITTIKAEISEVTSRKAAIYKSGGTSIGYVFAVIGITYGITAILTGFLL